MKKIIALVLAVLMLTMALSLVSCKKEEDNKLVMADIDYQTDVFFTVL